MITVEHRGQWYEVSNKGELKNATPEVREFFDKIKTLVASKPYEDPLIEACKIFATGELNLDFYVNPEQGTIF